MNIMYINNSRPLEKKCFTEKYGTHQCVLAVRESLLKELGTVVDDLVIEQVIRTGTADIGEKYLTVIRKAAGRKYYECDIDTMGALSRGAKRIIYSNDGLIYYTDNHYNHFKQL